jgi:uncharacterized protein (DUF305 family)
MNARVTSAMFAIVASMSIEAAQSVLHSDHGETATAATWSEFVAAMDQMHSAMRATQSAGDTDADFVTLMLPHHQAAIEMAKTELMHGTDPQLRRLAQEIIVDQQSEIELMHRWLQKRDP